MTDETPMKGKGKTIGTLTDSDIVTERKIGRRSLLAWWAAPFWERWLRPARGRARRRA